MQIDLEKRASKAWELLKNCEICPRQCRVNRLRREKGFCQAGDKPIVSAYHPHFGEEACLVGTHGSGTIFFTHCNLACVYCQNWEISQMGRGEEVSIPRLAKMMLELQEQGCHNINFISPTPYAPLILKALVRAREEGLKVPLVYNTNAYDQVETLRLLSGVIDIYMPDLKYADQEIARRYSMVQDYPQAMKKALKEMHRQVGDLKLDKRGFAQRGILVRHLVLPAGLAGTKEIMRFIAREISPNTFINIMDQYRPCYKAMEFPPLDRPITRKEFQQAIKIAREAGLERIA